MDFRKPLFALAATGLVLGATAASAAPVDVADTRSASSIGEADDLAGTPTLGWIIALLIVLGVIVIATSGDNEPDSP